MALHIQGSSTFLYLANLRSFSTVVFTIEKSPRISGPIEFSPMLFKGQLYCIKRSINGRDRELWEIWAYNTSTYFWTLKFYSPCFVCYPIMYLFLYKNSKLILSKIDTPHGSPCFYADFLSGTELDVQILWFWEMQSYKKPKLATYRNEDWTITKRQHLLGEQSFKAK